MTYLNPFPSQLFQRRSYNVTVPFRKENYVHLTSNRSCITTVITTGIITIIALIYAKHVSCRRGCGWLFSRQNIEEKGEIQSGIRDTIQLLIMIPTMTIPTQKQMMMTTTDVSLYFLPLAEMRSTHDALPLYRLLAFPCPSTNRGRHVCCIVLWLTCNKKDHRRRRRRGKGWWAWKRWYQWWVPNIDRIQRAGRRGLLAQ